jgi:hypothetical protein
MDFIFAFALVWGLMLILFAFAMTLSAIQITQYATFAATRSAIAGNFTPGDGILLGKGKFRQLLESKPFSILRSGFFELEYNDDYLRDHTDDVGEVATRGRNFFGARVVLQARILNVAIPFFGTTETTSGYRTTISSFLFREPAATDTRTFFERRWEAILALDPRFGQVGSQRSPYIMLDNGG